MTRPAHQHPARLDAGTDAAIASLRDLDILALVGDGVVCVDARGRIIIYNRAARDMFGHEPAEVLGRPVEILLPERFRARHAADVAAFAADLDDESRIMGHLRDAVGLRRSGEEFPVEATVSRRLVGDEAIMTVVVRDVSERKRIADEIDARNKALVASEKRLRLALRGGRMGSWEHDLRSGAITCDAVTRQLWGMPEAGDLTLADFEAALAPHERQRLRDALGACIETGADLKVEFELRAAESRTRWLAAKGALIAGADGAPESIIGVTFDATEQRDLDEQRRILVEELNHRLRNTMTLVNAVVSLSARSSHTVESYRAALQGRIGAVADTHGFLVAGGSDGEVSLRDQLDSELGPYRNENGANVVLEGPFVTFGAKDALLVRLAIHELATNAAKYGALSAPTGRVAVAWTREPDGRVLLDWTESGGPRVFPPKRKGFGTSLLHTLLTRSLGGSIAKDYRPEGLHCRVELPAGKPDGGA